MAKEKKSRTPRQPSKPGDETKAQAFKRLATQRVAKALKMLENISKLAGANYERTPEQCETIVGALQESVDIIKERFAGKVSVKTTFKLD